MGAKASVGAAAITRATTRVADWPLASTTRTVTVNVPEAVGVPLRRPVDGPSVSPAGRTPLLIDQANGAVPLSTVSCRL